MKRIEASELPDMRATLNASHGELCDCEKHLLLDLAERLARELERRKAALDLATVALGIISDRCTDAPQASRAMSALHAVDACLNRKG